MAVILPAASPCRVWLRLRKSTKSGQEKLTALGTENVSRKTESIQTLLPPADWAVAETEIVTKAPGGQ